MALCEILPGGEVRVLASRYRGKRLNSPNDLLIDKLGRIYFSDPRYLGPEPMELDHMSVYRYDPGGALTRLETNLTKPTGIVVSPDGKTMYIGESDNGSTSADLPPAGTKVRMTLNAYPIHSDGSLGNRRLLIDYKGTNAGVDGMSVDVKGNVYAAITAQKAIVVYDVNAEELARIQFPEFTTNCCFGRGAESKRLYVTAGKSLYRVRLSIDGYHPATAK
jgi:gluconolactonase